MQQKQTLKKQPVLIYKKFAKNTDLASLKLDVHELDIEKLKTVAVDLSKLSNVVNNAVKKILYDRLVTEVNAIDTHDFKNSIYNLINEALKKKLMTQERKYLILKKDA